MTSTETAILAANAILAMVACAAQMWAAATIPFRSQKVRHVGIGLLASLYAAGYVAVATGSVPLADWSRFFRGVSLLAWPVVWILPAIAQARTWRGVSEDAREIVRRAADLEPPPARRPHPVDGTD